MAGTAEMNYVLKLYVAGGSARCRLAVTNLRNLANEHLPDNSTTEVIDLLTHPELAVEAAILAVPTLVKEQPKPVRKVIGDLSNTENVLIGLGLQSQEPMSISNG